MSSPTFIDVFTGLELEPPEAADLIRPADTGASTYLVGPAFFDPQVNGFAGVDFQDPDLRPAALEHAVEGINQAGCSHILLTLISASADFLEGQAALVRRCIESSELLRRSILGIHLEGPFLSSEDGYAGAHPGEHLIPPDWPLFERLQTASGGMIRMVTLAPELPGAIDFIERASASGVCVALGHTDASMEQLSDAVSAGARLFTHLGNGCPKLLPRHENIIQRVLAVPELMVTLIPDGNHVPAPSFGNLANCLGPDRLALTTDAMSAAGAVPGTYSLGEMELKVGSDGIVMQEGSDYFAGSSLTMVDGFTRAGELSGLSPAAVWTAWTKLRTALFPDVPVPLLALPVPDLARSRP